MTTIVKLPSIQGLKNSNIVTVTFTQDLINRIEIACRKEWLDLHRIDHPNEDASPFLPTKDWLASKEGRIHMSLYEAYFVPGGVRDLKLNLGLPELNRILSRLQAQRYNVQGKRKFFEAQASSATAYRKFRNWWINRDYSRATGLEFNIPCPFEKYTPPTSPESYIVMGEHFEEWTGHKLPPQAWDDLKEMEKNRRTHFTPQAA